MADIIDITAPANDMGKPPHDIDGDEIVIVKRKDLDLALSYISNDDNGWDSRTTPDWFVRLAFDSHSVS